MLQPPGQWGRRAEDPFKGIEGWAGSHSPLSLSADSVTRKPSGNHHPTQKYPNPAEVCLLVLIETAGALS